jgi:acyl dehydratase
MTARREASLYYEDIELGKSIETRAHTITVDDVEKFCEVTHDHHPLHTDDDFARSMGFPRRIAHGLYGLSLMEGLKAELGLYDTTSIASLGWDDVRFRKPLLVGDRVVSRVRFDSKRPSRKKGRGVVVETVELVNQKGEVAISAKHATLVINRP